MRGHLQKSKQPRTVAGAYQSSKTLYQNEIQRRARFYSIERLEKEGHLNIIVQEGQRMSRVLVRLKTKNLLIAVRQFLIEGGEA